MSERHFAGKPFSGLGIVTETSYQVLEVKYHLAITLRSLERCVGVLSTWK